MNKLQRLVRHLSINVVLTLMFLGHAMGAAVVGAQEASQSAKEKSPASRTGVSINELGSYRGYTLIFPLQSKNTYLIDMDGRIVRTWESNYTAGQDAYLLENGHLLRAGKLRDKEALFAGSGAGGRIQEFGWDGQLVWDFKFHNEKQIQHHAITRMPNGNVLLIVWERKTVKQAIEAGADMKLVEGGEILVDSLVEIQPKGKTGGQVVWAWSVWHHLVQDHDKSKSNYGAVAAHPELVDVNFARGRGRGFGNLADVADTGPKAKGPKKAPSDNETLAKLKGLGYIGAGGGKKFAGFMPDWTHMNAVAYNPHLDQILLSPRTFNEIWVIDHSTTRAEAAGHTGGKSGKGGDLLYRWGNPRAYRAQGEQRLFAQHDAHWIAEGLPGAGHVLIFNNGGGRPDGNYSSADEIVLPVDAQGRYLKAAGGPFSPEKPVWSYTAPKKSDFYANMMSGAQRLPNGNTLISTGFGGTIFEVTPAGAMVWKYTVPNDPGFVSGTGPGGRGGRGGANSIFRAYRYGLDYSGLRDKDLTPGPTIEDLQAKSTK
jgi:hypothetical protein